MNLIEKLEQAGVSLIVTIAAASGAGILWVVRHVLTNDRKIALLHAEINRRDEWLKQDIARRDKQRDEDRDMVRDIGRKVDALFERAAR